MNILMIKVLNLKGQILRCSTIKMLKVLDSKLLRCSSAIIDYININKGIKMLIKYVERLNDKWLPKINIMFILDG